MVLLNFKVVGEDQLMRNLRVLANTLPQMNIFYNKALDIVEDRTDDIFSARGKNVEKAPTWRELAASTIFARMQRSGYYGKVAPNSPQIMRWSGRLQNDRTRAVSTKNASLTFNAPYAGYHQNGGGKLPKRAIIDLSNRVNADIVRAMQSKIEDDLGIFGNQV